MSWNRSYRNRTVTVKDRVGQVVRTAGGRPVTRAGTYKTEEAQVWQDGVRMIARAAKPTGFSPATIIVAYDFVLARDIDCDNVMKMANDAIAKAIDLNDKFFYPVVLSKVTGSKDPHIKVAVYDRAQWNVSISHGG
jgi:hypothetical protein